MLELAATTGTPCGEKDKLLTTLLRCLAAWLASRIYGEEYV